MACSHCLELTSRFRSSYRIVSVSKDGSGPVLMPLTVPTEFEEDLEDIILQHSPQGSQEMRIPMTR